MKAMKWGCGLAAMAALIWMALEERADRRAAQADVARSRVELRALAESVQEVQRELRSVAAQRTRAAQPEPVAALREPVAPEDEDERAVELEPEAVPEPSEAERTEQYVERADQVLATEARDPSWREASELPRKLETILPPGSLLESVRCGSSLCRIESKHRSLDAYNTFVGELASRPKPDAPAGSRFWVGASAFLMLGGHENRDPANEVHAIAYLAREKANIPSL